MMEINWKTIRPGMIIGCRNTDEVNMLLAHLEDLGYRWANGQRPTEPVWAATRFRAFRIRDDYGILATTGSPNVMVSDLAEVKEEPVTSKSTSSENMNGGLRLKPIVPDMVIECQDETEVMILLWYLEKLGYQWKSGQRPTEWSVAGCFRAFRICEDGTIVFRSSSNDNIMFKDLIEWEKTDDCKTEKETPDMPERSAKEVLEWLTTYQGTSAAKHCFGDSADLNGIFEKYTAAEIVEKITAFEASKGKQVDVPETEESKSEDAAPANPKPKLAEIEAGYHCMIYKGTCGNAIAKQYDLWGASQDEAWASVMGKAGILCAEFGGELSTMIWPICRKKGKEG